MALQAAYKQYLAAPNPSFLADGATLHYVTTTTTFKGPTEILKHVSRQRNQIKVKKELPFNVIEGQNAIAAEVDTVLEFVSGGGAYLPGLDDNFLADRTVEIPIMHIVAFDGNGKIVQIRQSWDQASLLKQVEVIGRTGRNWPIRDGKDQLKMIETCVKIAGTAEPLAQPDRSRPEERSRSDSNKREASLSLFGPRDEDDEEASNVISPKGGARPRERSLTEILADEPDSPSAGRERDVIAPKAGAGKNYQPSRLFDTEGDADEKTPEAPKGRPLSYHPDPKKYNHFDFADGSDPQDAPQMADPTPVKTKHSSQWDFEDFVTPLKAEPTVKLNKHRQEVVHWGNEDEGGEDDQQSTDLPLRSAPKHRPDADVHFEFRDDEQDVAPRKYVPKPRRDAETHFEFQDDGTPLAKTRPARPRGTNHNDGLGLYKNNLYDDDESGERKPAASKGNQALGNITNLNGRGRDFDPHFSMNESSPTTATRPSKVGSDRMKAVRMMESSWDTYDTSPVKENRPAAQKNDGPGDDRGIHIGGDGMGGSKGTRRDWLFGEDESPAKPIAGRKQGGAKSGGFNWDF